MEIQRIISEQYERAKKIIGERRSALDKIAEALLEHETIEGRHVLEILEFGEIRSPIAAAFVGKPAEKPEEKKAADKPAARGPRCERSRARRRRPPEAQRVGSGARRLFSGLDLRGPSPNMSTASL